MRLSQVTEIETVDNNNKPTARRSKYTNAHQKGSTGHNQYGNGWNEAGRKRFCDLMLLINKNRVYYNGSFDKRMLRYAKKKTERFKRNLMMKSVSKYKMPTEMTLPSAESIQRSNPDEDAMKQNMALMDYDDRLSGSEDETDTKEIKVGKTASI